MKGFACGSRHSVVITDAGQLPTFGWGPHGHCRLGNTHVQLRPVYVSALSGVKVA